jgi:hypothetical protein
MYTSQIQPLPYMKFELSFISCVVICDICNVIGFGIVGLYLWWINLKGSETWKEVRSTCIFLFKLWFPGMRCCVLGTNISEAEPWRQRQLVVPKHWFTPSRLNSITLNRLVYWQCFRLVFRRRRVWFLAGTPDPNWSVSWFYSISPSKCLDCALIRP